MTAFVNPSDTPDRDSIDEALYNYGFYHDLSHVKRMYAEYVNHGHYGYAGGVMDQPDAYWHDMYVMKNLELYVKHFAGLVDFTDQVPIIQKLKSKGPDAIVG
jgi:hypothetical protein